MPISRIFSSAHVLEGDCSCGEARFSQTYGRPWPYERGGPIAFALAMRMGGTKGLGNRAFPQQHKKRQSTDFSKLTDEMLAEIEWKLNHRPRESLGYRTPLEYCKKLFNFDF